MISILDTNSLRQEIAEELTICSSVILLSAYITKVGVDWLTGFLPGGVTLTVVGRFLPRDLKTGASDIEAIRTLLAQGYTVKALSSLHAKILVIDNKTVFLGSANYTGRGLGLVDNHNLEASVRLGYSTSSERFIYNIVESSFEVNNDVLDKFEEYLSNFDLSDEEMKKSEWPLTIFKNIKKLYVKDFPFAPVGVYHKIYEEFPTSDYARLYEARDTETLSRVIFKNSSSYFWIIQLLSGEECSEGVSFGRLSSYIHDLLEDDPAPYRRTVKDLQSNLYSFLKVYAEDIIQFYTPGARSEFIKLR